MGWGPISSLKIGNRIPNSEFGILAFYDWLNNTAMDKLNKIRTRILRYVI
jgi:hypothetical protein